MTHNGGLVDNEKIIKQLSSVFGQLKEELNNAFSDILPGGDLEAPRSPGDKENLERIDNLEKELKLTQYLLRLKERQLDEESRTYAHMRNSVLTLALALESATESAFSPEWMLSAFTDIMRAGSGVMWSKVGDKYSISTAHISVEEGEAIFKELAPLLKLAREPRISTDEGHHIFYTFRGDYGEEATSWVLIFTRNNKRKPFEPEDIKLGKHLAKTLFNTAIFTGDL